MGKRVFEIIQGWNQFIDFEDITYYHARKIEKGKAPSIFPKKERGTDFSSICASTWITMKARLSRNTSFRTSWRPAASDSELKGSGIKAPDIIAVFCGKMIILHSQREAGKL